MSVELKFAKSECNVPWGFRLVGGIEFDLPPVVVNVNEDSVAERCGLQVDDIIVRVNNISTLNLTHDEIEAVVRACGNEFYVTVQRGTLSEDEEVSSIFQDEIAANSSPKLLISENLTGQEEIVHPMTINQSQVSQNTEQRQRKWSTFLQKPTNPVPDLKKDDEDSISGERYRVVIKKQWRKGDKNKHVQFEDESVHELVEDGEVSEELEAVVDTEMELEVEIKQTETVEEEIQIEESATGENELLEEEICEVKSIVEIDVEEDAEPPGLTLEQQLLEVQKQLQQLSQLPTEIQDTLSSVTQQLANIVKANHGVDDEPEERADNSDDEAEKKSEAEEIDEEIRKIIADDEDEKAKDEMGEEEVTTPLDDDTEIPLEEPVVPEPTEAELEAMRVEEEKERKKQKILQWNQSWPWSDESKSVYSINFLKYQPPPKNLDYLQNSEVYRLVHEMEPPIKGISNRAEKILAEEDYYEDRMTT